MGGEVVGVEVGECIGAGETLSTEYTGFGYLMSFFVVSTSNTSIFSNSFLLSFYESGKQFGGSGSKPLTP